VDGQSQDTLPLRKFRAIPTLIIFKGANVSEQITGAVAKSQIAAAVDKAMG